MGKVKNKYQIFEVLSYAKMLVKAGRYLYYGSNLLRKMLMSNIRMFENIVIQDLTLNQFVDILNYS